MPLYSWTVQGSQDGEKMNALLLLIGGFFSVEGTTNVLFFQHFKKEYKSKMIFQLGRVVRAVLGVLTVIISLV